MKNTMLAPERRKLAVLVRDYVIANGGSEGNDCADHVVYTLPTAAGELSVTYDRGWGTIFDRFEDVEAAKKLLGTGPYNRLNPYSGKWNFHFGRVTAEAAFEQWTGALKVHRLLPAPSPVKIERLKLTDSARAKMAKLFKAGAGGVVDLEVSTAAANTGRWSGTKSNKGNTPKPADFPLRPCQQAALDTVLRQGTSPVSDAVKLGTRIHQEIDSTMRNALTPEEAEALEAAARYFLLLRETGKRPDDVAALESVLVKLERMQKPPMGTMRRRKTLADGRDYFPPTKIERE